MNDIRQTLGMFGLRSMNVEMTSATSYNATVDKRNKQDETLAFPYIRG